MHIKGLIQIDHELGWSRSESDLVLVDVDQSNPNTIITNTKLMQLLRTWISNILRIRFFWRFMQQFQFGIKMSLQKHTTSQLLGHVCIQYSCLCEWWGLKEYSKESAILFVKGIKELMYGCFYPTSSSFPKFQTITWTIKADSNLTQLTWILAWVKANCRCIRSWLSSLNWVARYQFHG